MPPAWIEVAGESDADVRRNWNDLARHTSAVYDGRELAIDRPVGGNLDIWILDIERASWRRLTRDASRDGAVAWTPDGSRLAYASDRSGVLQTYVIDRDGSSERLLTGNTRPRVPIDRAADGFGSAAID